MSNIHVISLERIRYRLAQRAISSPISPERVHINERGTDYWRTRFSLLAFISARHVPMRLSNLSARKRESSNNRFLKVVI